MPCGSSPRCAPDPSASPTIAAARSTAVSAASAAVRHKTSARSAVDVDGGMLRRRRCEVAGTPPTPKKPARRRSPGRLSLRARSSGDEHVVCEARHRRDRLRALHPHRGIAAAAERASETERLLRRSNKIFAAGFTLARLIPTRAISTSGGTILPWSSTNIALSASPSKATPKAQFS